MDNFGTLVRRLAVDSSIFQAGRYFTVPGGPRSRIALSLMAVWLGTIPALAQVSLPEMIESSLRTSPQVKMAEDNLKRATAAVTEAKDVYVPTVGVGSGLGASSGITLSVPTVFTVSAQSLVFNSSQRDYIRASRLSRTAAELTLRDARQQVEEDLAEAYISLGAAQRRKQLLEQQEQHATNLVNIVLQRLAAGHDTELEAMRGKRDAAEIHLQALEVTHRIEILREHLAALSGKVESEVGETITAIPPESFAAYINAASACPVSDGLRSAQTESQAKQKISFGDSRYTWRPQATLQAQYGRISPFNNVSTYYNLHGEYNTLAVGVQLQLPILDVGRHARARQSAADAAHAQHQAEVLAEQEAESCEELLQSISESKSQKAVSDLDTSIARIELNEALISSDAGVRASSSTLTTPKEEERAYLKSGKEALESVDIEEKLEHDQIRYFRLSGRLDDWLGSLSANELRPH